jgi:hypothetical protein
MGRWPNSLRAEEKSTRPDLDVTDKTDKTSSNRVLSVLSVRHLTHLQKFLTLENERESLARLHQAMTPARPLRAYSTT